MFSHLYPESLNHFPAHIFPHQTLPGYPLLAITLSINSVTKKIIDVHTDYFYDSGSIFTTTNFVTEFVAL